MLTDALRFPLREEIGLTDLRAYPNPVIAHPGKRSVSSVVDERIAQLIGFVRSGVGQSKSDSLVRLLPLASEANFLSDLERQSLAEAIWGEKPDYSALPETGYLLPHALLLLPTRDANRAETLIRSSLYDYGEKILEDTQKEQRQYPSPEVTLAIRIHESMASAGLSDELRMLLSAEQAVTLFDRLTLWRPVTDADAITRFGDNERRKLAETIGRALAYAVAPALPREAKTTARFQQLHGFYSDVKGAETTLPAFAYFVNADAQTAKGVEKLIASSLRSRDPHKVNYAVIALNKWMNMKKSETSIEFRRLTSIVVGIVESGRTIGLHQLLALARLMLKKTRLSADQCETLSQVVPDLFHAVDYMNVDPISRKAVTASTIRAECVRLALAAAQGLIHDDRLESLIVASKADPLPEVRFASHSCE